MCIEFRDTVDYREYPLPSSTSKNFRPCSAMAQATMKALVPIADGSEEIEAVSIIDTLRRTKQIEVKEPNVKRNW